MNHIRRFWMPLLWMATAAIAIGIMYFYLSISLYAAFGYAVIGLVAIFTTGWIATWEDDQPGGFNSSIQKEELDSSEPRS